MNNKLKYLLSIFLLIQFVSISQISNVTVSGLVKDITTKAVLPYVSVILKTEKDSSFITGAITNEEGIFTLSNIKEGNYNLIISYIGYNAKKQAILVGHLSEFLDLGSIDIEEDTKTLTEVEITAKQDAVSGKMDKKSFNVMTNVL